MELRLGLALAAPRAQHARHVYAKGRNKCRDGRFEVAQRSLQTREGLFRLRRFENAPFGGIREGLDVVGVRDVTGAVQNRTGCSEIGSRALLLSELVKHLAAPGERVGEPVRAVSPSGRVREFGQRVNCTPGELVLPASDRDQEESFLPASRLLDRVEEGERSKPLSPSRTAVPGGVQDEA